MFGDVEVLTFAVTVMPVPPTRYDDPLPLTRRPPLELKLVVATE
jgi:hypothetical protein